MIAVRAPAGVSPSPSAQGRGEPPVALGQGSSLARRRSIRICKDYLLQRSAARRALARLRRAAGRLRPARSVAAVPSRTARRQALEVPLSTAVPTRTYSSLALSITSRRTDRGPPSRGSASVKWRHHCTESPSISRSAIPQMSASSSANGCARLLDPHERHRQCLDPSLDAARQRPHRRPGSAENCRARDPGRRRRAGATRFSEQHAHPPVASSVSRIVRSAFLGRMPRVARSSRIQLARGQLLDLPAFGLQPSPQPIGEIVRARSSLHTALLSAATGLSRGPVLSGSPCLGRGTSRPASCSDATTSALSRIEPCSTRCSMLVPDQIAGRGFEPGGRARSCAASKSGAVPGQLHSVTLPGRPAEPSRVRG